MSLVDRFGPLAAVMADAPVRFARGTAIVLALGTLVQLAWATQVAYPWLMFVAHGGTPPFGLLLAVAIEACLAVAVILLALRADLLARLALMPVWGLVIVISVEILRGGHDFIGKWPFRLAFAIALLGWLVARRRMAASIGDAQAP